MEPDKPLDTTAAEPYEKYMLPTFMLRMGKNAVEKAAVQPGEGALDTGSASELIALLEICRN